MQFGVTGQQPRVVYQADDSLVQSVRKMRDHCHSVGRHIVNRPVRVQTMDGQTFEGTVVKLEGGILYMQTNINQPQAPAAYSGLPASGDYRAYPGLPGYGAGFGPGFGYAPGFFPAYNPYYQTILPLVLYELLVISLL
ncbi:hypothetical protein DUZ99_06635 [Xylanibacillus composti]|uniref:DUF2642 domain-containing protein n=1 Tax=Xylanibacillus composti TaxID=1572762 RepID=A0A8J4H8Z0_9BACL|nr:hypothetical protein [Xylanibacillus composti]MDT9724668.1 hypothetical protein [Xylanibacillus composti]GIQ70953.1 hypothetical protein XYCOK13_37770 [Xylanibacillus composti]